MTEEEQELIYEADKFGVIYDSNDLEVTKSMIRYVKGSTKALESRLKDLNVEKRLIIDCKEFIPCLLALLNKAFSQFISEKIEEQTKEINKNKKDLDDSLNMSL